MKAGFYWKTLGAIVFVMWLVAPPTIYGSERHTKEEKKKRTHVPDIEVDGLKQKSWPTGWLHNRWVAAGADGDGWPVLVAVSPVKTFHWRGVVMTRTPLCLWIYNSSSRPAGRQAGRQHIDIKTKAAGHIWWKQELNRNKKEEREKKCSGRGSCLELSRERPSVIFRLPVCPSRRKRRREK